MTAYAHPPAARASDKHAIKVMIVDDSLTVRTIFSRMVDADERLTVTGTAATAEQALMKLKTTPVDVILLDLEMPGMGGLEALPKFLEERAETKVLVISALTDEGAQHTLSALAMGAADTMLKPQPGRFDDDYRAQLIGKIYALGGDDQADAAPLAAAPTSAAPAASTDKRRAGKLLAIGASTGGIHALNIVLRALPESFRSPILVTQHLPMSFMAVFAKQVEMASGRPAVLADEGIPIEPGKVYIAPGQAHMIVRRVGTRFTTGLSIDPARSGCTPSVDPMLDSIADAFDGRATALILSGMGRDGVHGAIKLHAAGGTVLAQDEESSAIWGMPRAVTEAGLTSAVLPPESLADAVVAAADAEAWN